MIPTSLLTLVLFVALLAPGLAYVLRHERVIPAVQQSAFREPVRVIFVSVICLTITGVLFALIRSWLPHRTPNIRGLVRDPAGFAREHHVHLTWWALALLAFATIIGAALADPRAIRWVRTVRGMSWTRRLFGESPIGDFSAWREALTELPDSNSSQGSAQGRETFVGAQMADGTYVSGYLVSFNPQVMENDQRELILTRAKLRTADNVEADIGCTVTVISARHITRLDITHVEPDPRAEIPIAAAVQPRPALDDTSNPPTAAARPNASNASVASHET